MRILLVDDNPTLLSAIREMLEIQGHQVLEASGTWEALETADRREFDLLLTDLSMADVDGLELVELICDRIYLQERSVAILVMSSDCDYPGLQHRIVEGGIAFLRKPFSIAELTREMDTAVARKPELARLLHERAQDDTEPSAEAVSDRRADSSTVS